MSRGWRRRKRERYCASFRAARACRVRPVRDRRQGDLFASAAPSVCSSSALELVEVTGDGCAGRVACETMPRAEATAVREALRAIEWAGKGG